MADMFAPVTLEEIKERKEALAQIYYRPFIWQLNSALLYHKGRSLSEEQKQRLISELIKLEDQSGRITSFSFTSAGLLCILSDYLVHKLRELGLGELFPESGITTVNSGYLPACILKVE